MDRLPDPHRILEAIQSPLLLLDADGTICYANRAFRSGIAAGPVEGRSVFTVAADLPAEEALRDLLTRAEGAGNPEHTFPAADGRMIRATCSLLEGDGGKRLLMLQKDKTMESCRNQQLRIINRIIATATSSMTLDEILVSSLEEILTMLDFDAGAVYLINPGTGMADLHAVAGIKNLYFPQVRVLDPAVPLIHDVIAGGTARYCEQYLDVDHEAGESGIFSLAKIPITFSEEVLGVICIASSNRHRFSDSEKETLEAVGKKMGGAVRRGLLQSRVEEKHCALVGYITEATNRVIVPAEILRENLAGILADLDGREDIPEDLPVHLSVQVKTAGQILANLRELNRAIVTEDTEIPDAFREFLQRQGRPE
ncbi:hypothetical protein ABH15_00970 [Methanoculleus taiwanensis]|uniref:GAF domain-containing protein n=1 Tax=Methanoculleus taiwanensis TaxID=1550565 RepID=A0A498H3F3_9EURY|nr:GAF domain-containing protein [Methanoculleus taiwanensis]RXE56775.1 hypothetical protein ABH15_00970 [Methanoculleus taiwanensis]